MRGAALIPTSSKEAEGVAQPLIHAVVVTWQGAHLIGDCLKALLAQSAKVHVVVVDNGSTDGTAELVGRDFPGVEVVPLRENLGYGRGNNEAMRRAVEAGAQ